MYQWNKDSDSPGFTCKTPKVQYQSPELGNWQQYWQQQQLSHVVIYVFVYLFLLSFIWEFRLAACCSLFHNVSVCLCSSDTGSGTDMHREEAQVKVALPVLTSRCAMFPNKCQLINSWFMKSVLFMFNSNSWNLGAVQCAVVLSFQPPQQLPLQVQGRWQCQREI